MEPKRRTFLYLLSILLLLSSCAIADTSTANGSGAATPSDSISETMEEGYTVISFDTTEEYIAYIQSHPEEKEKLNNRKTRFEGTNKVPVYIPKTPNNMTLKTADIASYYTYFRFEGETADERLSVSWGMNSGASALDYMIETHGLLPLPNYPKYYALPFDEQSPKEFISLRFIEDGRYFTIAGDFPIRHVLPRSNHPSPLHLLHQPRHQSLR